MKYTSAYFTLLQCDSFVFYCGFFYYNLHFNEKSQVNENNLIFAVYILLATTFLFPLKGLNISRLINVPINVRPCEGRYMYSGKGWGFDSKRVPECAPELGV